MNTIQYNTSTHQQLGGEGGGGGNLLMLLAILGNIYFIFSKTIMNYCTGVSKGS
jgi:hypothetical protein